MQCRGLRIERGVILCQANSVYWMFMDIPPVTEEGGNEAGECHSEGHDPISREANASQHLRFDQASTLCSAPRYEPNRLSIKSHLFTFLQRVFYQISFRVRGRLRWNEGPPTLKPRASGGFLYTKMCWSWAPLWIRIGIAATSRRDRRRNIN